MTRANDNNLFQFHLRLSGEEGAARSLPLVSLGTA